MSVYVEFLRSGVSSLGSKGCCMIMYVCEVLCSSIPRFDK